MVLLDWKEILRTLSSIFHQKLRSVSLHNYKTWRLARNDQDGAPGAQTLRGFPVDFHFVLFFYFRFLFFICVLLFCLRFLFSLFAFSFLFAFEPSGPPYIIVVLVVFFLNLLNIVVERRSEGGRTTNSY